MYEAGLLFSPTVNNGVAVRKLSLAIGGSEKREGPPDSLSIHIHFYTISTFMFVGI